MVHDLTLYMFLKNWIWNLINKLTLSFSNSTSIISQISWLKTLILYFIIVYNLFFGAKMSLHLYVFYSRMYKTGFEGILPLYAGKMSLHHYVFHSRKIGQDCTCSVLEVAVLAGPGLPCLLFLVLVTASTASTSSSTMATTPEQSCCYYKTLC